MMELVRHGRSLAGVVALCLLPAVAGASGTQGVDPPQGRGGGRPVAVRPAELVAMLDAYELMQAQSALQLDDAQYAQFVTRLKRLQETRRRHLIQRTRSLQELRKLTLGGSGGDEAALRERLKALQDLDEQAAVSVRRDLAAVDEVLNARQQALFRLLEDRIERQKLDLLMNARERAARRAAPRGGGGTDK